LGPLGLDFSGFSPRRTSTCLVNPPGQRAVGARRAARPASSGTWYRRAV